MKKYAVIVAGGTGKRMGTQVPKQFLLLRGKPVLWHTLEAFLDTYEDLEIVLVLPEEHLETGRTMVRAMQMAHRIRVVAGGAMRFHSVQHGLEAIRGTSTDGDSSGEPSVIFVHDGVRCLLSRDLIHRCYEEAQRMGSAIPVIDSKDSLRLMTEGGSEAIERSRVKCVQTPQTFLSTVILPAFADARYSELFTDEATVVEAFGVRIRLVPGETANIKITTPEDLIFAEEALGRNKEKDNGRDKEKDNGRNKGKGKSAG